MEPVLTDEMNDAFYRYPESVEIQVNHSGLHYTNPTVIRRQIAKIQSATTVKECIDAYTSAKERWMDMGIFAEVTHSFEPLPSNGKGFVFNVRFHESKQANISVTADSKGTPGINANTNNLFGRAVRAEAVVNGKPGDKQFILSLFNNNPLVGRWTGVELLGRHQLLTQHSLGQLRTNEFALSWSPERDQLLRCGIRSRQSGPSETQERPVADDLQQDEGRFEKAYVRHEWGTNQLGYHTDAALYEKFRLPVQGWRARLINEITSDTISHELKGEWFNALSNSFVLGLHLKAAIIRGIFGNKRIHVHDRLFLEGDFVRGFTAIGPGAGSIAHPPPAQRDYTGGNILGALAATLNFPIPLLPTGGALSGHLFVNAGNLEYNEDPLQLIRDPTWWRRFINLSSVSCGAGIVAGGIPILGNLGRLEWNVSFPFDVARRQIITERVDESVFSRTRIGLNWVMY